MKERERGERDKERKEERHEERGGGRWRERGIEGEGGWKDEAGCCGSDGLAGVYARIHKGEGVYAHEYTFRGVYVSVSARA